MICSGPSSRVSFSRDLSHPEEQNESRRDTLLLDSCPEFEFNICSNSFEQPYSSADELFANGILLPVMLQRCSKYSSPLPPRPKLSGVEDWKKENMKKIKSVSSDMEDKKTQSSKSIWGFKRSNSLKCDKKESLLCSLPLLSRSNSTGSVTNPKRSNSKDVKNKSNQFPQKPFLKKNHGSCHGNGVRISPVLNVPPLFSLGSLLCNKKSKK